MFGMLRWAFTLLICVLIVGLYLGWFSLHQSPPDPQTNKVDINVSVDKKKMGSDLRTFEQKVTKEIQDIDSQPRGSGQAPPSGSNPLAPRLNIGPISVQPSGQPAGSPNNQPSGQPQMRLQTQGFDFTVPVVTPPPGEGR